MLNWLLIGFIFVIVSLIFSYFQDGELELYIGDIGIIILWSLVGPFAIFALLIQCEILDYDEFAEIIGKRIFKITREE